MMTENHTAALFGLVRAHNAAVVDYSVGGLKVVDIWLRMERQEALLPSMSSIAIRLREPSSNEMKNASSTKPAITVQPATRLTAVAQSRWWYGRRKQQTLVSMAAEVALARWCRR